MFHESGEFYDLIYGAWKDYGSESAALTALVRGRQPRARTILDVACGTGRHAKALAETHAFAVDGLDLDPVLVGIARGRNPTGEFVCADMTAFDLGRRYDAVLCLFSSIGYVRTLANLRSALRCFRSHLRPGGVLILEPWFTPSEWRPGRVNVSTAEGNGVTVCRMSRSSRQGRISILEFEYLIGGEDEIERRREVHEMGLFEVDEMMEAFAHAGLTVEHDADGLTGRGLYIAQRP